MNIDDMDEQELLALAVAYLSPTRMDKCLPSEGLDALFYMPGCGWERGELLYRENIVYGRVPYVHERHGNHYRASEYTHWLPLPPDPAD